MKKVLSILLCAVMLLSSVSVLAEEKVYNVSLDLNNKSPFGAFDGWGTSICWWGHHLGENLTEEQLDMVVKALYDEDEGLGLNIARYNIGGGDDPSHNHQREFDGRDMPGVLDKDGNWDLSRDAGQLLALQLCVKYGADIIEAFSNSPPYFMTESGCSSGNRNSGKNNLPDDKFDNFASFLAEAVLRIQNEYGIEFDTLEPFNESDTNYWGYEGWQEGCHFDTADHSKLIMLVRQELDKRGLTDVGVSASDETHVWRTGENIKNTYTKEAVSTLSQVNTHSYNSGGYDHLRSAALEAGKPLYMTEVDGDGSLGGKASGSMGPALWFANKINEDLRGLEPNAWIMWQATAMSYMGEHKDSGYWNICSFDKETNTVNKPKKYYAYMQYTRFIRPGDTLVKTDYSNIVSAINEKDGKVVFVVANTDSASKKYNFSLESLGSSVKGFEVYVTDKTRDCENLEAGSLNNVEVPAYSVTTVVIDAGVGSKSLKLTEKSNTATAFVGEELEFAVTDEKGNAVDTPLKIETNCNCMPDYTFKGNTFVFKKPHDTLTFYVEKDGMRAEYPIQIVGEGSQVRIIGSGCERALKVQGNDVVIADRDNYAAQVWTIEKHGNYYAFKTEKTGKYLSTESFLTTSELNDKALWTLQKDKGLYRIINKATGDSVDVYNHATENGSQVGVYGGYYATANQLFYFETVYPQTAAELEYKADEITLTGTPFGSNPWDGDANVTFHKAWDGDKETFFHADRDADRTGYTGIDLGENHLPFNKVVINSRPGFEYRGWGATLSGCDTIDGEYEVIYTFTEEDFTRGEEATVEIEECNYRYIKYETPQGGYCNVGEISLIYNPEESTGERLVIIGYYEDDELIKTETKSLSEGLSLWHEATEYDVRMYVMDKNGIIFETYFTKKY